MYTRAAASDYDAWETVYGNPGWGYEDLLPLFKQVETYQAEPGKETHGYSGPLKVSYGGHCGNLEKQFLEVAAQYDKTRSMTDDPSGFTECNAYARWPKWIDSETGRRSDVPHHYIYNRAGPDRLEIMTGCLVKRVIIEDGCAIGVEYVADARFHPDSKQEVCTVRARRLVVLSAGAFGSPAILERSGIGSEKLLRKLGIDTIVNLPGVGENYQDHQGFFIPYLINEKEETLDGIVRNDPHVFERWSAQWMKDGSGLMATNGIDAGIKLRPSEEELQAIGPDFHQRWTEFFANEPDKLVVWFEMHEMYGGDPAMTPPGKCYSVCSFLLHPSAVGHVHITSAEDVHAPPEFDPKFLSCKDDLALLRWTYKRNREFARRMPSYRGEFLPAHPVFSRHSAAFCRADSSPVEIFAPNLTWSNEDDKAIDDLTRRAVQTVWHSLGTCAMKLRDKGGVVDPRLNVYGVKRLKVADISIPPANVTANTYSTALVIGEKAAQIIIAELGIRTHKSREPNYDHPCEVNG